MLSTFRKLTSTLLLFCSLLFSTAHLSTHAQICQGSYDHDDNGLPFIPKEDFMCGSGRMYEQKRAQQEAREQKGFYDIEGFNYFGARGYFQKDNALYYSPHPDTFRLVANGDVSTLQFEGNFVRDKNAIYCEGIAQSSVNASAFRSISNSQYATDGRFVYFNAIRLNHTESDVIQVVEGADAASFRLFNPENTHLDQIEYAKDSEHLYYAGVIILGADLRTFKIEEGGYARDAQFVYYLGQKIEGSSGSTFKEINYSYRSDENQVYYHGQIVPNMKGSTFALIGQSGLGSDGMHICYGPSIIENGDPATFVDLGCGYNKDANQVYFNGHIQHAYDPKTFETFEWGYTKDKNGVYCDNGIIPGANPEKFEVLGRKYGRDDKHVYYLRTQVKDCSRDSFVADPADPNKGEDAAAVYDRGVRNMK